MVLLLFDRPDDVKPARVIACDLSSNRTYHYWHLFVPGARPGQIYGYRAQGPANFQRTECGLILPKCCSIRTAAPVVMPEPTVVVVPHKPSNNAATAMKSVVICIRVVVGKVMRR